MKIKMGPSTCNDDTCSKENQLQTLVTINTIPPMPNISSGSLTTANRLQTGEQNRTNEKVSLQRRNENLPDQQVGQVIAKTKRAAASLWMILHAQGCRLAKDNCPHQGCYETKKLLLHIKRCPAGVGFECPERYNGCLQARKLLAHYRKCREIRSRQIGRGTRHQQHPCLLCTLVARHVKNVLEGGPSPVAVNEAALSRKASSKVHRAVSPRHCTSTSNGSISPIQKFSISDLSKKGKSKSENELTRMSSSELMPPPPRRPPLKKGESSLSNALELKSSKPLLAPNAPQVTYGSPPTSNQLMQRGIEAVAKATGPAPLVGRSEELLLGKSFDSVRGSFFNAHRNQKTNNPIIYYSPAMSLSQKTDRLGRRRGMSFDERSSQSRVQNQHQNDPTIELMLKTQANIEEGFNTVSISTNSMQRRARSSSCSILTSCDTILEENNVIDEKVPTSFT